MTTYRRVLVCIAVLLVGTGSLAKAESSCTVISSGSEKSYESVIKAAKEKPVALVIYWASWCTYCHGLTSNLNKYNSLHPKRPIPIVAISLDDTLTAAKKEAKEFFPDSKNSFFCGSIKDSFKTRKLPYVELYHKGVVDTTYEGVSNDKISYMKKRFEWLSTGKFEQEEDEGY